MKGDQVVAQVGISPIRFYCRPDQEEGMVIPLGCMGEIVAPGVVGLGMLAVTELMNEQLEQVGHLGRELLNDPFDYLGLLFDDAWEHGLRGTRLEYLAERHCQSLNFGEPQRSGVSLERAASQFEYTEEVERLLYHQVRDGFRELIQGESAGRLFEVVPAA